MNHIELPKSPPRTKREKRAPRAQLELTLELPRGRGAEAEEAEAQEPASSERGVAVVDFYI